MNIQESNLTKVAYTPNEIIALGIAGSRTSLYRFVKEGRLRMTKRGRNSIFLAKDVTDFLASLCATVPNQSQKNA